MVALVLCTVAVLAAAVFAVWPVSESAGEATGAGSATAAAAAVAQKPTTLEGAVTAQLLKGEINPQQYRVTLERLAARDEQTHPLSVPERGDSSAGA